MDTKAAAVPIAAAAPADGFRGLGGFCDFCSFDMFDVTGSTFGDSAGC